MKKLLLTLTMLLCVSGGMLYVGMSERVGTSVQLSPEDAAELEAFAETTKERKRQREADRTALASPFPFNPNTADSATLIRVGLKSWQVKNLLAYRRVGGRWKDADGFKRLYGLSEEEYQRLRPYIQIPPPVKDVYFTEKDRARQDSLRQLRPEKFTELTVLDLNTVDTLTLRKKERDYAYTSQQRIFRISRRFSFRERHVYAVRKRARGANRRQR